MTLALVSLKDDGNVLRFILEEGRWIIGRSTKAKFFVEDLSVSRRHAEMAVDRETVMVRDLNSQNGTYVDGQKIVEARLNKGQDIRFGAAAFIMKDLGDLISELSTDQVSEASASAARIFLSPAQRRIFDLLVRGDAEKEIAATVKLSPHTIHNHVKAIYKAYDVHSRGELLAVLLGWRGRKL
jgi:pSer/pThr/pTyr-binding forkhead associated (FHA) protein